MRSDPDCDSFKLGLFVVCMPGLKFVVVFSIIVSTWECKYGATSAFLVMHYSRLHAREVRKRSRSEIFFE